MAKTRDVRDMSDEQLEERIVRLAIAANPLTEHGTWDMFPSHKLTSRRKAAHLRLS